MSAVLRPPGRFPAWAIGLSALVHGGILLFHFAPVTLPPLPAASALEVVLVNARHAQRPDKPTALAQANLDGGGNVDREARPSTPLPAQSQTRPGDALVEARRRVETLERTQQELMVKARAPARVSQPSAKPAPAQTEAPQRPSGLDLYDSAQAIARLEAQIDKRLDEYAQKPRRRFLGAQVAEYRFAQYVEAWRQKVERIGTLNYPDAARGRLYGSLLLSVAIRADGSLERVEVHRSSGHPVLDEAARRIVQMAAPFAPFPPDVRRDTDVLEITRTWSFTNGDQLSTR